MTDLHPQGVQNLVEAIVTSAARDWRSAMRILRKWPDSPGANRSKSECEHFFLSDQFYVMTGLNGRIILNRLYKEFDHEQR